MVNVEHRILAFSFSPLFGSCGGSGGRVSVMCVCHVSCSLLTLCCRVI
jgi:hypothetical protein